MYTFNKFITTNKYKIYLLLFVVAFLYNILFFNYFSGMLDEGSTYAWSMRMLNGDIPYKDFFTLITPASFWFSMATLYFSNGAIISLRVLTAVFASIYPIIVYIFIYELTKSKGYSISGFLLTLFMGLSLTRMQYTIYSNNAEIFGVLSLFCFILYITRAPKVYLPILAAGFLAMSGLFKQTIGLYFALAYVTCFIIMLVKKEKYLQKLKKFSLFFLTTLVMCVIVFCSYFAIHGALYDMFNNLVIIPLTEFGAARTPPPTISELKLILQGVNVITVYSWLFYFQVMCLVGTIIYVVCNIFSYKLKKSELNMHAVILMIFSIFGFLLIFERCSYTKVLATMPLNVILIVYVVFSLSKLNFYSKKVFNMILSGIVIIICVFFGYSRFNYFLQVREVETAYFPETKLLTYSDYANKYSLVIEQVETVVKNEEIFILPMSPLLYQIFEKNNPTRNELLIIGNFSDAYIEEIIGVLTSEPIEYIFFDNYWDMDGVKFSNYSPKLYNYITETYSPVWQYDDRTIIYKRNEK